MVATFEEAVLEVDGVQRRMTELPLSGTYLHPGGEERVVPVSWYEHRPRSAAFWKTGMFANQNSAARLRNRFTLETLSAEFGVENLPSSQR